MLCSTSVYIYACIHTHIHGHSHAYTYTCTHTCRLGGDKVACRYCQLLTELCVLLPGSSTASSSNLLQARSLWARTMAMLPTQLQVSMLCGTSSSSMDNLLQLCANMDLSCLHAGVLDSVSSSVLPSSIQLLTAPRASASDVV